MSEYDFSLLSERMRWIIEEKKVPAAELARIGDVSRAAISQITNGETKRIGADIAVRICQRLNISISWLVLGKGTADLSDVVLVNSENVASKPCVAIKPLIETDLESRQFRLDKKELSMLYIEESWFDDMGFETQNCRSFVVQDAGMAPYICKGDTVMVDTSRTETDENHVYLVRVNGITAVRRIRRTLKGGLIVSGETPDAREEFSSSESNSAQIIGQVVYRSGPV